jgi:aminopeptidase N
MRCVGEDRDSVWGLMLRAFAGASQLTEGDKVAEAQLKKLRGKLAKDWFAQLGWDAQKNDSPNTLQLRHTMLALTIASEDKHAIDEALDRFAHAEDISTIDAEIRSTILSTVVRHGKKSDINKLVRAYSNVSAEVQHDISGALTGTKDPDFANELILQALGEQGFVRAQDVMRWVALLLRNYYTRSIIWDWMVKNWDWLAMTLQHSKAFDYMPTYAAAVISTEAEAKKYNDLFEPLLTDKSLERNIKIGLADIAGRVAWRKRDEQAIKQWLANNV